MLKSPSNATDFDKSSELKKRLLDHEDNVKTVNRSISRSFSEKVGNVIQNDCSPSGGQCTNLHICATINVEYNIQPVSSIQSNNKTYSCNSVSRPVNSEANGIGYDVFEKQIKSSSVPQKRKNTDMGESNPPGKRCIIDQNIMVNMNNNTKDCHVSNNFGSESSFTIEPIPYVLRDEAKYVSTRSLNQKVFSVYAKYLTREVIECFDLEELNMTDFEVDYFNELSRKHPEYFFGYSFTTADKVLSSNSFVALLYFLKFCHDILVTKDVTVAKEKCGFVKITQTSVVPYIWYKSKKYFPLFYFESEDQCLNEMAEEISGPHLAYLRLCCKMQKIRKDFFKEKTCKVISLDNVAKFCPPDSQFEDEWPINVCSGLLTVETLPSEDAATTTVKIAEQKQFANNDTIFQTPTEKTRMLQSTSTDTSSILKVDYDQQRLEPTATNVTLINNVSARSHTNTSQIDRSKENNGSTEASLKYSELLKTYNELSKNPNYFVHQNDKSTTIPDNQWRKKPNPNYFAHQNDKSTTMPDNQWQKKPYFSNDYRTSNNRLLSPLSHQVDQTSDHRNSKTNQPDTTNNRLHPPYKRNSHHSSYDSRNHKNRPDILNGNNGLYKTTEATRLNIPVQYNVDTTNNFYDTIPHPEMLNTAPNRSMNSAVMCNFSKSCNDVANNSSTHQPENMRGYTSENVIRRVTINTPTKPPHAYHGSQWLAEKNVRSYSGGGFKVGHPPNNLMFNPVPDNNVTNNISKHQPEKLRQNRPQSATGKLTNSTLSNNPYLPNESLPASHDPQCSTENPTEALRVEPNSYAANPTKNCIPKPGYLQIADPEIEHTAGYKCCQCMVKKSFITVCVNMHPNNCSSHLIPLDEIRDNFYKWIPLKTFYSRLRNVGFELFKPNTYQTACLLQGTKRRRSSTLCIILEVYNEFSYLLDHLNSDQ